MGVYRNVLLEFEKDFLLTNVSLEKILKSLVNDGTFDKWHIGRVIQGKDDPFYVMNISQVLRKHADWCQQLPRIKPYYAVKCNSDSMLLAILARLGCRFDCASLWEIECVTALGVKPNRIIYANPCKSASSIRQANKYEIKLMTFDSEEEMMKIYKLYPNAKLILRISTSDPTAVRPLCSKFGCNPERVAPKLLKLAADLGIKVAGISFHVGTGCRDPSVYDRAIGLCRTLFNIGKECGHKMDVLDIGGGFPGHDDELPFSKIASVINALLDKYFPDDCGIRLIGEPGRFYPSFAYTLCVNVIARQQVPASRITKDENDREEIGFMYYVNDGTYGLFLGPKLDDLINRKPIIFKEVNKPEYWSIVWGPTCCSSDCLLPKERLPKLEEGDWIVFDNMGAYTIACSSRFNDYQQPKIYYIINKNDAAFLQNSEDLYGKHG